MAKTYTQPEWEAENNRLRDLYAGDRDDLLARKQRELDAANAVIEQMKADHNAKLAEESALRVAIGLSVPEAKKILADKRRAEIEAQVARLQAERERLAPAAVEAEAIEAKPR